MGAREELQELEELDRLERKARGGGEQPQNSTVTAPPAAVTPLEPGNIDLHTRPVVTNPDGSISTVRSIGVNVNGEQVVLPTVSEDGKNLTPDQAVEAYRATGKHLGKFKSQADADAYAQQLHEDQAREYASRGVTHTIQLPPQPAPPVEDRNLPTPPPTPVPEGDVSTEPVRINAIQDMVGRLFPGAGEPPSPPLPQPSTTPALGLAIQGRLHQEAGIPGDLGAAVPRGSQSIYPEQNTILARRIMGEPITREDVLDTMTPGQLAVFDQNVADIRAVAQNPALANARDLGMFINRKLQPGEGFSAFPDEGQPWSEPQKEAMLSEAGVPFDPKTRYSELLTPTATLESTLGALPTTAIAGAQETVQGVRMVASKEQLTMTAHRLQVLDGVLSNHPELTDEQRTRIQHEIDTLAGRAGEAGLDFKDALDQIRNVREYLATQTPQNPNLPLEALLTTAESAAPTVAGLASFVVTGSPAPAFAIGTTLGGAQTLGTSYLEAIDKLGPGHEREAWNYALVQGTIEMLGEAGGLGAAAHGGASISLLKRLRNTMLLGEPASEVGTQAWQDVDSMLQLDQDMTVGEALHNMGLAYLSAHITGAATALAAHAGYAAGGIREGTTEIGQRALEGALERYAPGIAFARALEGTELAPASPNQIASIFQGVSDGQTQRTVTQPGQYPPGSAGPSGDQFGAGADVGIPQPGPERGSADGQGGTQREPGPRGESAPDGALPQQVEPRSWRGPHLEEDARRAGMTPRELVAWDEFFRGGYREQAGWPEDVRLRGVNREGAAPALELVSGRFEDGTEKSYGEIPLHEGGRFVGNDPAFRARLLEMSQQPPGPPKPSVTERMADPDTRQAIEELAKGAGWAEQGGRMVRGEDGQVTARTAWVPISPWWKGKPEGVTKKTVDAAIQRLNEGGALRESDYKALDFLLSVHDQLNQEQKDALEANREHGELEHEDQVQTDALVNELKGVDPFEVPRTTAPDLARDMRLLGFSEEEIRDAVTEANRKVDIEQGIGPEPGARIEPGFAEITADEAAGGPREPVFSGSPTELGGATEPTLAGGLPGELGGRQEPTGPADRAPLREDEELNANLPPIHGVPGGDFEHTRRFTHPDMRTAQAAMEGERRAIPITYEEAIRIGFDGLTPEPGRVVSPGAGVFRHAGPDATWRQGWYWKASEGLASEKLGREARNVEVTPGPHSLDTESGTLEQRFGHNPELLSLMRRLHGVEGEQQASADQGDLFNHDELDVQEAVNKAPAPIFYSGLARTIETIGSTATPDEWLNRLESWSKGGKIVEDELEFSGLREWLTAMKDPGNPKKLTPDIVAKAVREGGATIEESLRRPRDEQATPRAQNPTVAAADDRLARQIELRGRTWREMRDRFGWQGELEMERAIHRYAEDFADEVPGIATAASRTANAMRLGAYTPEQISATRELGTVVREIRALEERLQAAEAQAEPEPVEDQPHAKWLVYTEPGGTEYRELILYSPQRARQFTPAERAEVDKLNDALRNNFDLKSTERQALLDRRNQILDRVFGTIARGTRGPRFTEGHFDIPDTVAHTRFKTRTDKDGTKTLFVEEIQSDWAEQGRQRGFRKVDDPTFMNFSTWATGIGFSDQQQTRVWQNQQFLEDANPSELDSRDLEDYAIWRDWKIDRDRVNLGIDAGPFVQSTDAWVGLTMKRLIRYAAENGHTRIAWATGDMHNSRYNLEHTVDRIVLRDNVTGGIGEASLDDRPGAERGFGNGVRFFGMAGRDVALNVEIFDRAGLVSIVGEGLADRLLEAPARAVRSSGLGMRERSLSGVSLRMGGDPMRTFYDKIVPAVTNKVLKKLGGGRVVDMTVPTERSIGTDGLKQVLAIHGLTLYQWDNEMTPQQREAFWRQEFAGKALVQGFVVTPELADRALQGLPLFNATKYANALVVETNFPVSYRSPIPQVVNRSSIPEAMVGAKFQSGKTFRVPTRAEQAMISSALGDLDAAGLPFAASKNVQAWLIHINPEGSSSLATWLPAFRVISFDAELLAEAGQNMLNTPLQQMLRGVLAHEIGHSIDVSSKTFGGGNTHSIAAHSERLEGRYDPESDTFEIGRRADLFAEIARGMRRNENLADFLSYPLAAPYLQGNIYMVKAELHAQLTRLYFGAPEWMQASLPQTFEAYREIYDQTRSPLQIDERISKSLWALGASTSSQDREARQARQEATGSLIDIPTSARLEGLPPPTGQPGRGSLEPGHGSSATTGPPGPGPRPGSLKPEALRGSQGDMFAPQQRTMFDDEGNDVEFNSRFQTSSRPDEIRDFVERTFRTAVNERHVPHQYVGIYRTHFETIRLRNRNDLETLGHELGHHFSNKEPALQPLLVTATRELEAMAPAGYQGKGHTHAFMREEGFAEFLTTYLHDPGQARQQAPAFYPVWEQYLTTRPRFKEAFEELQARLAHRQALSAEQAILQRVGKADRTIYERTKRALAAGPANFIFQVLDRWDPIKRMVQESGVDLPATKNPYLLARMLAGNSGMIEDWLTRGTIPYDYQQRLNVSNYGAPLAKILEPVFSSKTKADKFVAYIIARRADELMRVGKERLLPLREITAGLRLETPEFRQVAQQIYDYNDRLLDYRIQAGILTPELAAKFRDYEAYIPFFRYYEEPEGSNPPKGHGVAIHRLTGGTSNLNDIVENLTINTAQTIHAANRNAVLQAIDNLVRSVPGMGIFAEPVPVPQQALTLSTERIIQQLEDQGVTVDTSLAQNLAAMQTFFQKKPLTDPRHRTYVFMRDGEYKALQINDRLLWQALNTFEPEALGWMMRALSIPAQLLRAGVVLDPRFFIGNFFRDTISATVQARGNFTPVLSTMKGAYQAADLRVGGKQLAQMADNARLWRAFQGSNATMWSSDPEAVGATVRRMARRGGFAEQLIMTPRRVIELLEKIGGAVESGTRVGEFSLGPRSTGDQALQRAFDSREVSTDFGMHGASPSLRILTRLTPFMNPAMQGLYKTARVLSGEDGAKAQAKASIVGLAITALSVALYLLNRDKDWYNELEDWERNTYWHFDVGLRNDKGKVIPVRLPKPFEYGLFFASIPEALTELKVKRDGKEFRNRLLQGLGMVLGFRVVPTVPSVMMDWASNHDSFLDRRIIPDRQADLEPMLQYSGQTTLTAREFGKVTNELGERISSAGYEDLGQAMKTSPANTDFLVRGFTGGLGMYALLASDQVLRLQGDAPEKPGKVWYQYPVLSKFFHDPDNPNTRDLRDFYDALEKSRRAARSIKALEGDETYATRHEPQLEQAKSDERVGKALAGIRGEVTRIQEDKELTGAQKREDINELNDELRRIVREYMQERATP